jgi:hypothetical protein
VRPFAAGGIVPQSLHLSLGNQTILAEVPSAGGPSRLRNIDAATGETHIVATRLDRQPASGSAFDLLPPVLVSSAGGDLLLDGLFLRPFAAAPAGIDLSPAAVAPGGAYEVFTASLLGATVPLLRLPGGSFVALPPEVSPLRVTVTARGSLLLDGQSLRLLGIGVSATVPTSGPVRLVLSGAST